MRADVIDLFHGDVVTDFTMVKRAGIKGIIHKATQGVSMSDPAYAPRRQKAREAGLLWGAYHFNTGDPIFAQVQHFLDAARPDDSTLMALDFEDNRASQMTLDQAQDFLERLDKALGRKAVIYSGNRIKTLQPQPDPFFASHRLWLCEYGPTAKLPASWPTYFLWQFTGDGIGPAPHAIPGITTQGIDVNLYNGDPDALAEEWAA